MPNLVALSPSVPVLHYIERYLTNTQVADQLPLHELFQLLRTLNTATGAGVNLPDPTAVLPYLNLFSLVILNPASVAGLFIPTAYLPGPSSLQNNRFRPTRTRSNSVLIFDAMATAGNATVSHGIIPLSSEQPEFNVQRYWRLPINTEIILAILCDRISSLPLQTTQSSAELGLTRTISALLLLQGGGRGRGGGDGNGNAAGMSKTREKGEPEKKRLRVAAKEDLDLIEGVERARDQSRPITGSIQRNGRLQLHFCRWLMINPNKQKPLLDQAIANRAAGKMTAENGALGLIQFKHDHRHCKTTDEYLISQNTSSDSRVRV